MKKRLLVLGLCLTLLLTGCSAMLDRPYTSVVAHAEHPVTGEDDSTVQVESYSELVSAVLYFVSQSTQQGTVRLVNYDGDVEEDLNRACLEVAKDDPLGSVRRRASSSPTATTVSPGPESAKASWERVW